MSVSHMAVSGYGTHEEHREANMHLDSLRAIFKKILNWKNPGYNGMYHSHIHEYAKCTWDVHIYIYT